MVSPGAVRPGCLALSSISLCPSPVVTAGQTSSAVHNYAPSGRPLNGVRLPFSPRSGSSRTLGSFADPFLSSVLHHASSVGSLPRTHVSRYPRARNATDKQINQRRRFFFESVNRPARRSERREKNGRSCPNERRDLLHIWVSIVCGTLVMFETSSTADCEKWYAAVPSRSEPRATK